MGAFQPFFLALYPMKRVSFIGAGNLAFRMAIALNACGYSITHIYNRSKTGGERLAKALRENGSQTCYTENIEDLSDSDIIIIAISDDAIESICDMLRERIKNSSAILVHTSGATQMSILESAGFENMGVFYPLMTLSRSKNIDFSAVPLLIESSNNKTNELLTKMAKSLGSEFVICDSERRLQMHIAAVFSCNFVNVILGMAFDIADKDKTLLLPATMEMVRKSFLMTPDSAQTGPALRDDLNTIEKHIDQLSKMGLSDHKEVYELLTEMIRKRKNK